MGSPKYPSFPKLWPKVKRSPVSSKSLSIVWNFPVIVFHLLISTGLKWGTLAQVHDSDSYEITLLWRIWSSCSPLSPHHNIWDGEMGVFEEGLVPPKGACQWRSQVQETWEGCWRTGSGGSAEDKAEKRDSTRWAITRAKRIAGAKELNQNEGIWVSRKVSVMRSGQILLRRHGTAHWGLFIYVWQTLCG